MFKTGFKIYLFAKIGKKTLFYKNILKKLVLELPNSISIHLKR